MKTFEDAAMRTCHDLVAALEVELERIEKFGTVSACSMAEERRLLWELSRKLLTAVTLAQKI